MSQLVKPVKAALVVACFMVLALAAPGRSLATDLPSPDAAVPVLGASDYLDRYAELMQLRARFAAILPSDLPELLRLEAQQVGMAPPSAERAQALGRDLTAELHYYVVNLKYLIWADGAIWPEDRPTQAYRSDALAELAAISDELATGDPLVVDIDALLHRLEQVNAWTEGLDAPDSDAFDPAQRRTLVEDAGNAAKNQAHT